MSPGHNDQLNQRQSNIMRTGIFIGLTLALGLAGAGCGHANSAGGAPATSQAQQKADRNQMNPQQRDKLQQGGKLIWAIDSTIVNFNTNQLDVTQMNNYVVSAMMPSLFLFDAAATPRYDPDYLTAEPTLTPGPPQVVTYELNPKAVWYDGTPITAADLIAQWKALKGSNIAFHIASSNGYDHIASVVQGAGKYEAIVTFSSPYADWKALYSPLYPASTNNNADTFNDGWKSTMLTSGGPFRLQNYDATAKAYTLIPNEKWWGNKPKLDEIVFRVIDDDATPTAMANGEVDLMDVGPSADEYNRVKTIPGVDIRAAGGPNFRHLTMNGMSPMLQDVRVRQALAMSIDRLAIAKAELGQLPVHPVALGNHLFMENQTGYQDNSGVVAYNPVKARQMLDAAGWTVQGKSRVKNGQTLAINLVIPGGVAVSRSEGEIIQNMLAQVNVQMAINTVPTDNFFDKYITPGQFDFTVFAWMGTPFPVSSGKSIYLKPVGDKIEQNYARIGSDELDKTFGEAVRELDPQKAIILANAADKLIWEEVHSLTMYQRPDIWAVKKGLANIGAYGFASVAYEDISWMSGSSAAPR
jgi:peptide/nickel transport system substrate-binding protein